MRIFLKIRVANILLASLVIALLAIIVFYIIQESVPNVDDAITELSTSQHTMSKRDSIALATNEIPDSSSKTVGFSKIGFWSLTILSTTYSLYFIFFAAVSLRRQEKYSTAPTQSRFALVVAARNEASVIGNLVDSLRGQNYPNELYDIYVAPNNCTDNTKEVALKSGAKIFTPTGVIKSKGEVLRQVVGVLLAKKLYDAICVFDADNLAHPDFLKKMNDARFAGAKVAQGFRDSKNPTDTPVSTCYSIFYWIISRFYNGGRAAFGLSSFINGTGFMVDTKLLKKLGGWNTKTISEDYEFSAQCVLAGERVHYVPDAIIYDEQPLTFVQSWKQRRRWATGAIENCKAYFVPLMKFAIAEQSKLSFDLAITFFSPVMIVISTFVAISDATIALYKMLYGAYEQQFAALFLGTFGFCIICSLLAVFIIILNRREITLTIVKGIGYFPFFMASWTLIGVISIFSKKRKWDIIEHTRSVSLQEVYERPL